MSDDGGGPHEKPGIKERIAAASPFLAHVIRMLDHYGQRRGNLAAGGATYFGFLSFFPLLAVSFAVVGQLSEVYPDAQQDFVDALSGVLPGIVSVDPAPGRIALSDIASNAPAIYTIGLATALYAGLNWVSGLRDGLNQMLDLPTTEAGNIVKAKGTDLVTLVVLGLVLVASVSIGGLPVALGSTILDAIGLRGPLGAVLLTLLSVAVGVAVSTLLFWAIFRLLPKPDLPAAALWRGALFSAVGFELIKQFASLILRGASSVPVASLAIALTWSCGSTTSPDSSCTASRGPAPTRRPWPRSPRCRGRVSVRTGATGSPTTTVRGSRTTWSRSSRPTSATCGPWLSGSAWAPCSVASSAAPRATTEPGRTLGL